MPCSLVRFYLMACQLWGVILHQSGEYIHYGGLTLRWIHTLDNLCIHLVGVFWYFLNSFQGSSLLPLCTVVSDICFLLHHKNTLWTSNKLYQHNFHMLLNIHHTGERWKIFPCEGWRWHIKGWEHKLASMLSSYKPPVCLQCKGG